jgi:osmotically-inducible protein OsmY
MSARIEVRVEGGEVILSGPILRKELDDLLRRVARVRGVYGIRNELEVHQSEGSVPGLQSGSPGPTRQSRG